MRESSPSSILNAVGSTREVWPAVAAGATTSQDCLSIRLVQRKLPCPPPMVIRPSRSCACVASTLTGDSEWRLFGQVERWLLRARRSILRRSDRLALPLVIARMAGFASHARGQRFSPIGQRSLDAAATARGFSVRQRAACSPTYRGVRSAAVSRFTSLNARGGFDACSDQPATFPPNPPQLAEGKEGHEPGASQRPAPQSARVSRRK